MYAIGMDIGGTNTVIGIVDREGHVVCSDSVKTQNYPVINDYISAVGKKIKMMMECDGLSIHDIAGLGIGAPNGNYYRGTVEYAPNLPWKGVVIPLADLFSQELGGMKVVVTNDANAAAMGEKAYGAAKDMNHFIMITLGTGVGAGVVIDGKMLYGKDGFAGELGHIIVKPDGRQCSCGRKGCLEAYCSATGIVRTAKEHLRSSVMPSLLRDVDIDNLTSKDIYDAAVEGDQLAIDIFNETGTLLGQALANMVAFTSPEAIILFGGLAKAGDLILKPTYEAMEENMFCIYKGTTKLLMSQLNDADAAILGASALVW